MNATCSHYVGKYMCRIFSPSFTIKVTFEKAFNRIWDTDNQQFFTAIQIIHGRQYKPGVCKSFAKGASVDIFSPSEKSDYTWTHNVEKSRCNFWNSHTSL